jgi:mitochondrial translocator assembly and maintenance protein 41
LRIDESDQDLLYALKANLSSALHVALLLLPEQFTLKDLFLKITSLSYNGDFRMYIGENRNKIANIVIPQIDHFVDLYSTLIMNDTHLHWNKMRTLETTITQEITPTAIFKRLLALPKYVIYNIMESTTFKTRQYQDTEEVIRKLCVSTQRTEKIEHAVRTIVKRSSWTQACKGVLTAGFMRSSRYALAKLSKMIR